MSLHYADSLRLKWIAEALDRIADALEHKAVKADPWWNARHTGNPSGNDYDVLTGNNDHGC